MASNDWLAKLKEGDTVLVCARGVVQGAAQVERVTTTQVVVDGHRYRRATGHLIQRSDWVTPYLREATPEALEALRKARLRLRFTNGLSIDWSKVPDAKLERIAAILDETEASHG